jgi:large subunit ribosomal protein L9
MKLILTHEVTGLGGPGDIVEVKDGYGRNWLLPRGFAIRHSRGAERQIAQIQRAREVRQVRDRGQAAELAGQLASLAVRLPVRAGRTGRLFGSVTTTDVANAVRQAGGPNLDKRRIEMTSPIKTVGSHTVSVRLHPEVTASIALDVTPAD